MKVIVLIQNITTYLMHPKNPRPKGVVMNGWLSLS